MNNYAQPSGLIPDDLLTNIKKGDSVLFLGADVSLGYEGAPPSRPELATLLAKQYDLPLGQPWPETAQTYLDRSGDDRDGLIAFLRRHLGSPDLRPGPTHIAIARAGFRGIVTAWYDDLLERALADYDPERKHETIVVRLYGRLSDPQSLVLGKRDHQELVFQLDRKLELVAGFCHSRPPLFVGFNLADPAPNLFYVRVSLNKIKRERRVYVVWPQPIDIAQTSWHRQDTHLVAVHTTPFLQSLVDQLPQMPTEKAKAIRVERPPYKFLDYYEAADKDIFCGRDTETQIVTRLALSHRLLTLFGPSGAGKTSLLLAGVVPRLATEGYQHVYVRALDDPLVAVRRSVAARAGRTDWDSESDLRTFLMSVLRTGVPPIEAIATSKPPSEYRTCLRELLTQYLDQEELRTFCFDLGVPYDMLPGESLITKIIALIDFLERRRRIQELIVLGKRQRPDIAWDKVELSTPRVSVTLQPASDKLVIILDQFEELFLRVGDQQRLAFFRELAAVLDRPEREVRFIFSLREDYLAHLDEARAALPDILANSYRLSPFDRTNARVAITEPAARAGAKVQTALVDALLGSEGRDAARVDVGDLVEAGGRVPPAALQIVLNYLYRAALPQDHPPDDPPPSGLSLTVDHYRAARRRLGEDEDAEELTGAKAILAGYVNEGIAELSDARQQEMGREILKVMITSQETKAALTHTEIIDFLEEAGVVRRDRPRDLVLVEDTRLGLERVRLLRGFERDDMAYYELAHDHLAAEIATWIGQQEMKIKVAREILRRAVDNWHHAGLLIPPEALELIHTCCEELYHLSAEELELLFRSALAAGTGVAYWFDRAREGRLAVDSITREGLESETFRTRAAAVETLAKLGDMFVDPIIDKLDDEYPQVRMAAIRVLDGLRPDGAWRAKLVYECYVPAGPFLMGSEEGNANERPAHEITLEAYYIGKYPVTNADYKRYSEDSGQPFEVPDGKENHPVVNVNWYDARSYASWAGMRLPTEAEWEKAASWEPVTHNGVVVAQHTVPLHKSHKRVYPWGNQFDKDKCNTDESGIGNTTSVGQYSPAGDSPYGCADMAGNVWEWCSSLYGPYPYRADDGLEDMRDSGRRMQRGGSFDGSAQFARAARRLRSYPGRRGSCYGFRVAATSLPPQASGDSVL
jgi:hypothetical protein